jgi:tetratricopeptide (TPR) repeat protein
MSRKAGKSAVPAASKTLSAAPQTAVSPNADEQVQLFDQAVSRFTQGDYAAALPLFERAAAGPLRDLAAAARSRAQICQWRVSTPAEAPQSAEDHYHYGLAHFNQRRYAEAERHFLRALELAPNADYVLYALALSQGWKGDLEACAANLRKAIELNPANVAQARKDPDFQDLLRHPAVASVLYPLRGGSD